MVTNTSSSNSEIRYLQPVTVDKNRKKYCRFKKSGIKYIDYKDPEFLKKFLKSGSSRGSYRARLHPTR